MGLRMNITKKIIYLFLLFAPILASCSTQNGKLLKSPDEMVTVYHDEQRGVTCWIAGYPGGMSCLPDKELKR